MYYRHSLLQQVRTRIHRRNEVALKVERFGLRDKQTHWNASNRPYVSRLWPRPEGVESAQLGNHASKTIATGLGIRERGHCENDMDGAVAQAQRSCRNPAPIRRYSSSGFTLV
jgi:hypothetical protein